MQFPLSTGQAAQVLGVSEPQLNHLIRKGRISPLPAVSAGRRIWMAAHLRQAAEQLGKLSAELDQAITRAVAEVEHE